MEKRPERLYGVYVPMTGWTFSEKREPMHTHELMYDGTIEPLPKEECQHVPKVWSPQSSERNPGIAILLGCSICCLKCGVELEPMGWKEKELPSIPKTNG